MFIYCFVKEDSPKVVIKYIIDSIYIFTYILYLMFIA